MSQPSKIVLLVEDDHHKRLLWRYLRQRGVEPHAIRVELSPPGEGSAEQWVRSRFGDEVAAYRDRIRRARTALIVMIDADQNTVLERLTQFDQALSGTRLAPLHPGEQVARLVPKRNVETWLVCLNGEVVDEVENCKRGGPDWGTLIKQGAVTLSTWVQQPAICPDWAVASLKTALDELRRLVL